jgi:hypothetical protein
MNNNSNSRLAVPNSCNGTVHIAAAIRALNPPSDCNFRFRLQDSTNRARDLLVFHAGLGRFPLFHHRHGRREAIIK